MKKMIIGLLMLAVIWRLLEDWPLPTRSALAPAAPDQQAVAGNVAPWDYKGYHFVPLAAYSLKARVLHRDDYYFDASAPISPFDLALGWGRMSDPAIYGQLSISQAWRWYSWSYTGEAPIPDAEISASSANTHIIPGNPAVAGKLYWVHAGDVVRLSGYLVSVTGPNEFTWASSLSRTDTGTGACEVMWVNDGEKVGR